MAFERGAHVAMREVYRGTVWAARPMTVVRDDDELVALWFPRGTRWKKPRTPDGDRVRLPVGEWDLLDDAWDRNDNLILVSPGAHHAVHVFFDPDGTQRGWYVNLQEPLRRTALGFDYFDHALDIVIAPDLSDWRWKDEDELALGVELGVFTGAQARAIRAEGERVLAMVGRRAGPFGDAWGRWRSDPAWGLPEFPPGWSVGVRLPPGV